MSNVNDALSSLYLELPGDVAADVNSIVRNHIANLEAENARLRDVLEKIADGQDGTGWRIQSTGYAENVQRMAREALREESNENI